VQSYDQSIKHYALSVSSCVKLWKNRKNVSI